MKMKIHHDRLLVLVLQDVIRRGAGRFPDSADLAEALKTRCAQLRIHYDAATVTTAIVKVEQERRRRGLAGVLLPPRLAPVAHQPELVEQSGITRSEARAILARVFGAWR